MLFTIGFYTALAIFACGVVYKVSAWFRHRLHPDGEVPGARERVFAAGKGIVATLVSPKIRVLVKTFVFDILLQRKIWQESAVRWTAHMMIFGAFMMLLLMHALDDVVSEQIFNDYYPTRNPFLFLRNLFGFMALAGTCIALCRRLILKAYRVRSGFMDYYALAIVAAVVVSGILLEGVSITSYTDFDRMEEAYADLDDEDEIKALEAFWVAHFGLVSPRIEASPDPETISLGREIHGMYCAECHSRPQWGFLSYTAAKMIEPVAVSLDQAGFSRILWYLHIGVCFFGLAALPFTKMFHIIASPISLLVNAVSESGTPDLVNIFTRRIMELDACTHCGACSFRCAVGVVSETISNGNILPSEKITSLKKLAAGKPLPEPEITRIQQGLCLCTRCGRCTRVCPVGIDLQKLWHTVCEALLQRGTPEPLMFTPFSIYRGLLSEKMTPVEYSGPVKRIETAVGDRFKLSGFGDSAITAGSGNDGVKERLAGSTQGNTFSHCFTCKTCTSACPIVQQFENPQKSLGLVPHQIMQATALGMGNWVLGSKMLWSCLGCYKCQEHCPQGVRITDVFYELKNIAVERLSADLGSWTKNDRGQRSEVRDQKLTPAT